MGLISRVSSRTYRFNYENMEADFLPYEPVRKKSKQENGQNLQATSNITKNKLVDLRELINRSRTCKAEKKSDDDFESYESMDDDQTAILSLGEETEEDVPYDPDRKSPNVVKR